MPKIISLVNQKGGVGKTTTAVNLGAYLSSLGKFVLLVDIDPQANATSGLGIDHRSLEKGIYDTLVSGASLREIIKNTNHDGYRVAPATLALAGANVELINLPNREFKLREVLQEAKHAYDYILIDCPPSLGLLTVNGLVAADEVLIPVQAEYYALEGLGQLLETVNLVKDNLHPDLDIKGAVLTMFDARNKLSSDVLEELYKFFPNKIFRSVIPRSVRLAEAPSFGKSILHYDPSSKGGKAYERLAREIIEMDQQ
ncbi:MAG: Chromosome segregation ATPase [Candidatus Magasanikbacteria bacterium GW2011_GWC2_40_17]|uniref:Chromosome segregation ATPase n=1 Tax=Candidatus Magasanikbacteria bacterium GW2011_GWA2_42_32 TaxID=1619039 RepID=A0A0G1CDJ4_9BACT|nr:MAG: Chromosome segregation ATPase [Candidatus Magasanikbacteria bacterium GW2011_GWC2_40_17]KKS56771.1 MAG: Chromosome segregation ATPase [Candidatus Magasanikbacteria bacterium GW2011_GWA2_42_32]OGH86040.1 MAG: chromosome partitioning protein ParA [Candidatus Magasanikbacteria bacterium RIFOXYB2_FULL_38_10]